MMMISIYFKLQLLAMSARYIYILGVLVHFGDVFDFPTENTLKNPFFFISSDICAFASILVWLAMFFLLLPLKEEVMLLVCLCLLLQP